jgi:hypothetical protein
MGRRGLAGLARMARSLQGCLTYVATRMISVYFTLARMRPPHPCLSLLVPTSADDISSPRRSCLPPKPCSHRPERIAPPFSLIRCCTRSALKKINRIGDKGEPCGSPACSSSLASDTWPFTTIVAMHLEQKALIQFTKTDGNPLAASR